MLSYCFFVGYAVAFVYIPSILCYGFSLCTSVKEYVIVFCDHIFFFFNFID